MAGKVLEADLAQTIMVLITVAAGVCYGWIEGYVINAQLGNQSLLPYVLFNHFTMYQIAVGVLLGLITGGFALIKARSMFAKGNRYFLFAVLGNYPFSWAVEDFTYFLFNPLDALSAGHWSTWFLGGVYAYSPWMPGHPKPECFIPTWYFLVLVWFLGCNWYAHRCTVYDNLIKDEIGQRILPNVLPKVIQDERSPTTIPTPVSQTEPPTQKKTSIISRIHGSIFARCKPTTPVTQERTVTAPRESTPVQKTTTVVKSISKRVTTTLPTTLDTNPARTRSEDAETALKRLRQRWLKNSEARTGE